MEGLKRSLRKWEDLALEIKSLTTDRHIQIRKLLREEKPHIKQWFDCWHITKSKQSVSILAHFFILPLFNPSPSVRVLCFLSPFQPLAIHFITSHIKLSLTLCVFTLYHLVCLCRASQLTWFPTLSYHHRNVHLSTQHNATTHTRDMTIIIDLSLRMWFCSMISGVEKGLLLKGKKKGQEQILSWAHSISNHLYWSVATSEGDGELVCAKWKSIVNHVTNVHECHGGKFAECAHGPLTNRDWIKRAK